MKHEDAVKIKEAYDTGLLIIFYYCEYIRVVSLVEQDDETSGISIEFNGDSDVYFVEDEKEDFEFEKFEFYKKIDLENKK